MLTEELFSEIFLYFIGREPEKESINYWMNEINNNGISFISLINFLKESDEGQLNIINQIRPELYEIAIKKLYFLSGKGKNFGNPFYINKSKIQLNFIHIPKTAGISIINKACDWFHPLQISNLSFERNQTRNNILFSVGHCSINQVDINSPNSITFTVLRNPGERVLSLYHFLRKNVPDDQEYWGFAAKATRGYDLEKLLSLNDPNITFPFLNYYIRVFSGHGLPFNSLLNNIGENEFNQAKLSLKKLRFVLRFEDILENENHFNEINIFLAKKFSFELKGLPRLNIGNYIKTKGDQKIIDKINNEICWYDYQLYKEIFNAKLIN